MLFIYITNHNFVLQTDFTLKVIIIFYQEGKY